MMKVRKSEADRAELFIRKLHSNIQDLMKAPEQRIYDLNICCTKVKVQSECCS